MHDLKGAWPPLAQGLFETGPLVLLGLLLASMIGRSLRGRVSGFSLMFTTLEEKGAEGAVPVLIHIPKPSFSRNRCATGRATIRKSWASICPPPSFRLSLMPSKRPADEVIQCNFSSSSPIARKEGQP